MTEIGPHLLGRLPSPPDERDWKLENFVGLGDEGSVPHLLRSESTIDPAALAQDATSHLKLTQVTYKKWAASTYPDVKTTHWWQALNDLALIIGAPAPPPPTPSGDVEWLNNEPGLDQDNYGTCTGNGGAQFCNTLPVDDQYSEGFGHDPTKGGPYARSLYYETTVLDGSPDVPTEPPDYSGGQQGATVRSLMKALKNRGRINSYAVTTSVAGVRAWLDAHGPVIFGTDWLHGMFTPDSNGYIHPTGNVEGGHCYLAVADLQSEDAIKFLNSWGEGWGLYGYFKMKTADVQQLLSAAGEAWTAPELPIA